MDAVARTDPSAILVLHTDPFAGIMIEDILAEAGAGKVVVVFDDDEAEEALAAERFSAALLGVYVDYSEILPLARILTVFTVPFVVWGPLIWLPNLYGLSKAPLVASLASPIEFSSAFASIGIILG